MVQVVIIFILLCVCYFMKKLNLFMGIIKVLDQEQVLLNPNLIHQQLVKLQTDLHCLLYLIPLVNLKLKIQTLSAKKINLTS